MLAMEQRGRDPNFVGHLENDLAGDVSMNER
jgi:hypothetical protein